MTHLDNYGLAHDRLGTDNVDDGVVVHVGGHGRKIEAYSVSEHTSEKQRRDALTVHIAPEADALLEELSSLAQSEHHLSLAGGHDATRAEEAIACVEHRVQHRLVQQSVAHPLGHNDVDLVVAFGQLDVFHLPADDAASLRQSGNWRVEGDTHT